MSIKLWMIFISAKTPEMCLRVSASNNLANSLSTALVESNPTNSVSGNLANPPAIEEPLQYDHWLVESRISGGNNYKSTEFSKSAEAKDTNTECESGFDGEVSVLQSPNPSSSSCKVKES